MTAAELAAYIGREGDYFPPGSLVGFPVKVVDARLRYGTLDFSIHPIRGSAKTGEL